jgi:hypothetical protein
MTVKTLRYSSLDTTQLTQNLTSATYGFSLMGFISSMTFERWVTIVSVLLALATFGVNWYYKHAERRDRLAHYHTTKPDKML